MTKNDAILKIRRELQKDEFSEYTVIHYKQIKKTVIKAVDDEHKQASSENTLQEGVQE